jgi:hypothetical protein
MLLTWRSTDREAAGDVGFGPRCRDLQEGEGDLGCRVQLQGASCSVLLAALPLYASAGVSSGAYVPACVEQVGCSAAAVGVFGSWLGVSGGWFGVWVLVLA